MKDFQRVLDTINETANNAVERGTIANYIPELAKIDMQKFGIHLIDIGQHHFSAGKGAERFSIQYIKSFDAFNGAWANWRKYMGANRC